MAENGDNTKLRYKDKVTIVTGGCHGIGRGITDVFVNNGAKVVVLDIDDKEGNSLSTSGSGELFYIHCDVTKEDDIKQAIEQTAVKYGRIDCLINNAGVNPPPAAIDDVTSDDFRKLLDLNLIAYFLTCKYALPYIRKVQGNVINNSSINALVGARNTSIYCATKGGIIAMTKGLAVDESKYGVRVNAFCPGPVRTPLYESFVTSPADEETYKTFTLLNKIGEPSEIGKACLFLAVDATLSTGISLSCSAGMELGFGVKG